MKCAHFIIFAWIDIFYHSSKTDEAIRYFKKLPVDKKKKNLKEYIEGMSPQIIGEKNYLNFFLLFGYL